MPQLRRLSWRVWDGEVVVYNDVTGNTHHLGALASEVFEALLAGPAKPIELMHHVVQALNLESTAEVNEAVSNVIKEFYEFGLIELAKNANEKIVS